MKQLVFFLCKQVINQETRIYRHFFLCVNYRKNDSVDSLSLARGNYLGIAYILIKYFDMRITIMYNSFLAITIIV